VPAIKSIKEKQAPRRYHPDLFFRKTLKIKVQIVNAKTQKKPATLLYFRKIASYTTTFRVKLIDKLWSRSRFMSSSS